MRKILILSLSCIWFISIAWSGVKVTSLDLATQGVSGSFNIGIQGNSRELPEFKVNDKTIELTLSGAENFSTISKVVRGAQLSAHFNEGKVIARITLPYHVPSESINLGLKNNRIEVSFPRGTTKLEAKMDKALPVEKINKESLDEAYLNKLAGETQARVESDIPKPPKSDEVKTKQSSATMPFIENNKNKKEDFSFAGYALKFTAFLALVLGLFYGIVQLLKKGVFRRGKLGFLNNTKMIEVLSTTYVSPKRALMIVKAHNQIFLVANSESGIEFLSEIKDTAGILKEGEKAILGSNFDMSLLGIKEDQADIKLKEDINVSTPVQESRLTNIPVAKDIVKFSDELKNKAKKLKPIEFS